MNAIVKPKGELEPINSPVSEDSRVLMLIVQKMSDDPDFDIDKVKAMIDIKRGLDADNARKAFNLAVAEFKRNPPVVIRDMLNKQYGSTYASIASVVNTTNAALAPHGLSASWEIVEQTKDGMRLACVLEHSAGHSKRVELWGPMDASGSKNPLQQVKSTMTYLKIATFEAVTGIASREGNQDDDGNGAATVEYVSDEQLVKLREWLEATGADEAKFLKYLKVDSLSKLPAKSYQTAVNALRAKEKAK